MDHRICLIIAVLVAAFLAIVAANGGHYGDVHHNVHHHYYQNQNKRNISHNLIIGKPGWGDRLLYNYTLHVKRKLFRIVTYNFNYPVQGYPQNYSLTAIQFWDLKTDGTGAYAKLTGGGIGYRNVSAYLESQRSHGIHFQIVLYGH